MARISLSSEDGTDWIHYDNGIGKSRRTPFRETLRESGLRIAYFDEILQPSLSTAFQEYNVNPQLRLVGSTAKTAAVVDSDIDILPVIFDGRLYKPTQEACIRVRTGLDNGVILNHTPLFKIHLHDVYHE